jgi:hypothetical protein
MLGARACCLGGRSDRRGSKKSKFNGWIRARWPGGARRAPQAGPVGGPIGVLCWADARPPRRRAQVNARPAARHARCGPCRPRLWPGAGAPTRKQMTAPRSTRAAALVARPARLAVFVQFGERLRCAARLTSPQSGCAPHFGGATRAAYRPRAGGNLAGSFAAMARPVWQVPRRFPDPPWAHAPSESRTEAVSRARLCACAGAARVCRAG